MTLFGLQETENHPTGDQDPASPRSSFKRVFCSRPVPVAGRKAQVHLRPPWGCGEGDGKPLCSPVGPACIYPGASLPLPCQVSRALAEGTWPLRGWPKAHSPRTQVGRGTGEVSGGASIAGVLGPPEPRAPTRPSPRVGLPGRKGRRSDPGPAVSTGQVWKGRAAELMLAMVPTVHLSTTTSSRETGGLPASTCGRVTSASQLGGRQMNR